MKLKKWLALALALTLTASLAACSEAPSGGDASPSPSGSASAESDLAYIQDKGTLVVAITDFAPMDYQDANGEWIGFDADMARAVAEKLGVEVQFQVIEWDSKLLELNSKKIDCAWNGMTLTNEVLSSMECTNAYATNGQVVVMNKDALDRYADEESLKDLSFAVESGSAGEETAADKGFKANAVSSQADALMEVAAGTSDACIIDLLMATAMTGEGTGYPDLAYGLQLTTEEYGIGFRKGSDAAAKVNEALKELYDDGTMQSLAETYGIAGAIIAQ
ncbi:transporter substrate-binding domain-containing protein [Pseudoflavonifractor phocaeensis]|uniref:transporter substrate-binding domain-containing protein n=1 Tax=Pseudoflavonifractor phocaeensis TaxID=1870988 RepID=UPI00210B9029|nr:transporter substrate-binding domain-containing protein [Pseudoflavonifractor phocaeensis]MCQ4863737.1 transporter substrate-binding domain-containing protein [Pseudoflavonifractor phocaeensis]